MSGSDGGEHRCGSDNGLAGSHIALQQAGHRLAAEHVIADLGQDPLLGGGQFEGQCAEELIEEVARHRDWRSIGAQPGFSLAGEHGQLDREEFLERDSLPGQLDIFQAFGEVDDSQGRSLAGKSLFGDDLRRQRLAEERQVVTHRSVGEPTDGSIGQAFRPRIDR